MCKWTSRCPVFRKEKDTQDSGSFLAFCFLHPRFFLSRPIILHTSARFSASTDPVSGSMKVEGESIMNRVKQ